MEGSPPPIKMGGLFSFVPHQSKHNIERSEELYHIEER